MTKWFLHPKLKYKISNFFLTWKQIFRMAYCHYYIHQCRIRYTKCILSVILKLKVLEDYVENHTILFCISFLSLPCTKSYLLKAQFWIAEAIIERSVHFIQKSIKINISFNGWLCWVAHSLCKISKSSRNEFTLFIKSSLLIPYKHQVNLFENRQMMIFQKDYFFFHVHHHP